MADEDRIETPEAWSSSSITPTPTSYSTATTNTRDLAAPLPTLHFNSPTSRWAGTRRHSRGVQSNLGSRSSHASSSSGSSNTPGQRIYIDPDLKAHGLANGGCVAMKDDNACAEGAVRSWPTNRMGRLRDVPLRDLPTDHPCVICGHWVENGRVLVMIASVRSLLP